MNRLSLGLLALAFSTSSVFAQDYLNCGLKIADNKIDCPFFGSCPQEVLKESKSQLFLELNEGDTLEGKIAFKKVLLFPGTSKEKKNKVTIFKSDLRTEMLKSEKKVDLVAYDTQNNIDYTARKVGNTLSVSFKSAVYTLSIDLEGNGKYQDYILTSENAVSVICERLNKEVYEEFKAKKEAIDSYNKEKSDKSKASKQ
ncbi:MAG TPA: hypothetical protein VNJ08_01620 [Bacteriovoracaceae bacterium]|nr:hypothetical protein [Bacteriovoracaceae bacterium]